MSESTPVTGSNSELETWPHTLLMPCTEGGATTVVVVEEPMPLEATMARQGLASIGERVARGGRPERCPLRSSSRPLTDSQECSSCVAAENRSRAQREDTATGGNPRFTTFAAPVQLLCGWASTSSTILRAQIRSRWPSRRRRCWPSRSGSR
jgi:hypothetical protein